MRCSMLQSLVLNLQEEIFFAEDVAIVAGRLARGVVLVFHQPFGDFALQAARKSDQSLANVPPEISC